MKEQLEKIKSEALAKIDASDALEKLNEIRVAYLGKKGELTTVLKSMKDVAPEERPEGGPDGQRGPRSHRGAAGGNEDRTGKKSQRGADEAGGDRCDPSGKEGQYRPHAIPTPLPWRKWSGSSWAWAMRWWKDRRWNTICITLKN